MVKVRAIKKCFIDNRIRQIGEEFDHPGDFSESVMIALVDEEPTALPKKSKVAKKKKKTDDPIEE